MFHHLVPKRCATKIGLINITNMSCAFMSCALEIKSNGRLKRAHVEFCALIPKTYLHYQSAYGHQLCHCDDLPCGAVTHISHMTLGLRGLARSHEKLKTSPLPGCLWPLHLAGWWLFLSISHAESYATLWSRCHARQHVTYCQIS